MIFRSNILYLTIFESKVPISLPVLSHITTFNSFSHPALLYNIQSYGRMTITFPIASVWLWCDTTDIAYPHRGKLAHIMTLTSDHNFLSENIRAHSKTSTHDDNMTNITWRILHRETQFGFLLIAQTLKEDKLHFELLLELLANVICSILNMLNVVCFSSMYTKWCGVVWGCDMVGLGGSWVNGVE